MRYNPSVHHRRSIRLSSYDYSQVGAYFVTICVQNRECLFGEIAEGEMQPSEYGRVVGECWEWLAEQYQHVQLDEWVVMPNHLHGILVLSGERRGGSRAAPTISDERAAPTNPIKPLGSLVGAFKTVSAKRINQVRSSPGAPVWQRNYYEHVIRNEDDLSEIRQYIVENPAKWSIDRENPQVDRNTPGAYSKSKTIPPMKP